MTHSVLPFSAPMKGSISVPGSKSITNRILPLVALSGMAQCISGVLRSEDSQVMLSALEKMGISIHEKVAGQNPQASEKCKNLNFADGEHQFMSATFQETVTKSEISQQNLKTTPRRKNLTPNFSPLSVSGHNSTFPISGDLTLHCQNSGTSLRFLTALSVLRKGMTVLTGIERMKHRPIGDLVNALRQLGVRIEYLEKNGFPPIAVHGTGRFDGGEVQISGNTSSQFITALFLLAAFGTKPTTITIIDELVSKPYVEMTIRMIQDFGVLVKAEKNDTQFIVVPNAHHKYQKTTYPVEGDATSATYPLAIAAVTGGKITVSNIPPDSLQGDTLFAQKVLERMGCHVSHLETGLCLKAPPELTPLGTINLEDMPDAAMTAVVLAAYAQGSSHITGLSTLRHKECDRIHALVSNLINMGADISATDDSISIIGNPKLLHGAKIETYNDHRVAMCFAVLGSVVDGVQILHPKCVEKTYPTFFAEYEQWRRESITV